MRFIREKSTPRETVLKKSSINEYATLPKQQVPAGRVERSVSAELLSVLIILWPRVYVQRTVEVLVLLLRQWPVARSSVLSSKNTAVYPSRISGSALRDSHLVPQFLLDTDYHITLAYSGQYTPSNQTRQCDEWLYHACILVLFLLYYGSVRC